MNPGIYSLSASMINQLNRVDVISNNIANSNTTGFKQDNLVEGSFNNYMKKAQEQNSKISKDSMVHNTIPKIDGDYITADVGSVTMTGNKLDFALTQNEIFFKVQDKNSKEIVYTRDGSFKNLNGFLSTAQGDKILNSENEPILVEDGFESQISLVKTPFTNLDKIGNNNYIANDSKQVQKVILNDTQIVQGSIERSNVNTVSAMVALIESQRRLEQSQKAITGIDDINSKLIRQVGNS